MSFCSKSLWKLSNDASFIKEMHEFNDIIDTLFNNGLNDISADEILEINSKIKPLNNNYNENITKKLHPLDKIRKEVDNLIIILKYNFIDKEKIEEKLDNIAIIILNNYEDIQICDLCDIVKVLGDLIAIYEIHTQLLNHHD